MDSLFNMNKVKYKIMKEFIIDKCIELKNHSKFDIFINLEMIIRDLENSFIQGYYRISEKEKHYVLISNIFNLASHYRKFFKINNHYCRIFFYFNLPKDKIGFYDNQLIMKDYRKDYIKKFLKSTDSNIFLDNLYNGINLIKEIFDYVGGVYLIDSESMEPSLVPYVVMNNTEEKNINIIITKDIYEFQYAKYGCYILKPNKRDEDLFFNPIEALNYIPFSEKILREKPISLGVRQIPFILSVLGDRKRNIPRVRGYGMATLLRIMEKAIEKDEISANTDNLDDLLRYFNEFNQSIIMENFLVTDLDIQYNKMKNHYDNILLSNMKDKTDIKSLRELADNYFIDYPLYLEEILQ